MPYSQHLYFHCTVLALRSLLAVGLRVFCLFVFCRFGIVFCVLCAVCLARLHSRAATARAFCKYEFVVVACFCCSFLFCFCFVFVYLFAVGVGAH